MTIFMTMAWSFLRAFWKPIAVILVVIAVYSYAQHSGRVKERGIWVAKIEAERKAQNIIANAHEAIAVKELEKLNEELESRNAQINELLAEADRDANAARVCLGTDSLQRINRGR